MEETLIQVWKANSAVKRESMEKKFLEWVNHYINDLEVMYQSTLQHSDLTFDEFTRMAYKCTKVVPCGPRKQLGRPLK